MKKFTSTFAAALLTLGMFLPQYAMAQAPQKMSYQSVIRNATGDLVTESSVGILISILQGSALGTEEYVETHSATTNVNGLASLEIGMGAIISGTFADIDWGNGPYFIKTEIDPSGGTSYSMSATSELLSVPYALYAETSGNPGAFKLDDLSDSKSDSEGSSVYIGSSAGFADVSSTNNNVGIGKRALQSNTSGSTNTAIGHSALFSNSEGSQNTAIGFSALTLNTTGFGNVAIGSQTLFFNNGSGNTAIGTWALISNLDGSYNTAIGRSSLYNNTTGDSNTAIGGEALRENNTGDDNTAIGYASLLSNIDGFSNTATGTNALQVNTVGSENTATGFQSLYWNDIGIQNTANGNQALQYNKANENTATGYQALNRNTDGVRNTANGYQALYLNTTGNYNTATGYKALYGKTTGHWNTAIGRQALSDLNSGTNNIGIGYNAQSSSTSASNQVTIGNSANNVYRMFAASWTNASDRQLKHAIKSIPVGLDLVLKLRPVEFVYNNANNEEKTFGFIAQEVMEAVLQSDLEENILVSPLNNDYLGLRTTELISVLTKAIQEQQEMIDSQNSEIESLDERLNKLEVLFSNSIQQVSTSQQKSKE